MPDDAKPLLRRQFRNARRSFVAGLSARERSALYGELARIAAPALAGFVLPASYVAIGDEIDPIEIETAFTDVGLPRVEGSDLSFRSRRLQTLLPGALGIPEPSTSAPQLCPDLVLVPLLAATLAGVRLGQGKGYYDRALASLARTAPARTIGLAWDCQIAEALPVDPWDVAIDFIATPTRLVDCRAFR